VTSIEVSVPHSDGSPLIDRLPRTGLEGKFSLDYNVARALFSGRVELADFTDTRVLDAEVRRLMTLHQVEERRDGWPGPTGHHTSVAVRLADGRELRRGVDVTHGDARSPLSDAEFTAKVVDALGAGGWKPAAAAALMDRLASVPDEPSLGWLQAALRGAS
jgi:2-methylcitrate dehydratase PrpD